MKIRYAVGKCLSRWRLRRADKRKAASNKMIEALTIDQMFLEAARKRRREVVLIHEQRALARDLFRKNPGMTPDEAFARAKAFVEAAEK